MKVINSIFYRSGKLVPNDLFKTIYTRFPVTDDIGYFEYVNLNLGLSVIDNAVDRSEAMGHCVARELNIHIIGDVTLYNRVDVCRMLGVELTGESNTSVVLKSYIKWGENCVKYLMGDFAFIIYDEQNQKIFTARDPLGQKSLYYYLTDDIFIVSNRLQTFNSFHFSRQLDDTYVVNYLQNNHNNKRDTTVFREIKKFLPGHKMTIFPDSFSYEEYWNLSNSQQLKPKDKDEAVEGLIFHLRNAVVSRLGTNGCNAVELSGGLDSSAVAAFAQEYLVKNNSRLIALSNVLPLGYKHYFDKFTDEWDKASLIARHLGIQNHIGVEDTLTSPLGLLEKSMRVLGYPTGTKLLLFQTGIFDIARREGVRTLLSGFGGDQMVTAFARHRYIQMLLREGKVMKALLFSRRHLNSFLKAGINVAYNIQHMMRDQQKKEVASVIRKRREESILTSAWFGNEAINDSYFNDPVFRQSSIKERSFNDIYRTELLERIESGNILTYANDIEYKHPFLHIPLLEYFYSLPDEWKADHKNGRALIRLVLKDMLPEKIVEQPKKDFIGSATIPFVKVIIKKSFEELKDYCLSIPAHHDIFQYVDMNKVLTLKYNETSVSGFDGLLSMAGMVMFMNSHEKVALNEV